MESKVHEGYNQATIANDVAVVKVSEPFTFDGKKRSKFYSRLLQFKIDSRYVQYISPTRLMDHQIMVQFGYWLLVQMSVSPI